MAWTPAIEEPMTHGARIVPQHGIEEHANMANTNGTSLESQEEKIGASARAPAKQEAAEKAAGAAPDSEATQ